MKFRRRSDVGDLPKVNIGSQLLGLSLFVMLLAFFIVLNSISDYQDSAADGIISNLGQTFGSRVHVDGDENPSLSRSEQMQSGEGSTVEKIEALFKAQVRGLKVAKGTYSGVMMISIPRTEFERMVKDMESEQNFTQTLASLVRSEGRGSPYQMEILYGLQDNPGRIHNQDPAGMDETIQSISLMASVIERAGLPSRFISAGLQKGDPEMVDLIFKPYSTLDPDGGRDGG